MWDDDDWRVASDQVRQAVQGSRVTEGGWFRGNCPFCVTRAGTPDRRRSLGLSAYSGVYVCFRCGARGKVSDFVGSALPPSSAEALEVEPPESFLELAQESARSSMTCQAPLEYLAKKRQVSLDRVAACRIGYCWKGRYANHIVVPVLADDHRTWLGFVGRRCTAKKVDRPYNNMPGPWRSKILYNHKALHEETDEPVVLVEGCFDAISVWPHGVAMLGKTSACQFEALTLTKRPIAVVLDGDAHVEGWALSRRLQLHDVQAGTVRLPPKIDPDNVPCDVLLDAARRCIGSEIEL